MAEIIPFPSNTMAAPPRGKHLAKSCLVLILPVVRIEREDRLVAKATSLLAAVPPSQMLAAYDKLLRATRRRREACTDDPTRAT